MLSPALELARKRRSRTDKTIASCYGLEQVRPARFHFTKCTYCTCTSSGKSTSSFRRASFGFFYTQLPIPFSTSPFSAPSIPNFRSPSQPLEAATNSARILFHSGGFWFTSVSVIVRFRFMSVSVSFGSFSERFRIIFRFRFRFRFRFQRFRFKFPVSVPVPVLRLRTLQLS